MRRGEEGGAGGTPCLACRLPLPPDTINRLLSKFKFVSESSQFSLDRKSHLSFFRHRNDDSGSYWVRLETVFEVGGCLAEIMFFFFLFRIFGVCYKTVKLKYDPLRRKPGDICIILHRTRQEESKHNIRSSQPVQWWPCIEPQYNGPSLPPPRCHQTNPV